MICIYGKFGVRLKDHFYMSEDGPGWFTEPSPSIDDPFGYEVQGRGPNQFDGAKPNCGASTMPGAGFRRPRSGLKTLYCPPWDLIRLMISNCPPIIAAA